MIFHEEINLPNLINNEFSLQFTAKPPGSIQFNLNLKVMLQGRIGNDDF